MNRQNLRARVQCSLFLLISATGLGACSYVSNGRVFKMFGFFKEKERLVTVASEVGADLKKESSLPKSFTESAKQSFASCEVAQVKGVVPDVEWTSEEQLGETLRLFKVPAQNDEVPLAITVTQEDAQKQLQIWELSNDKMARFVRRREVKIDSKQHSWAMFYPEKVLCLPSGMLAVAVGYHAPAKKLGLYLYSRSLNEFHFLEGIAPDYSTLPHNPFDSLAASSNSTLILFHTGEIRLKPETYAYKKDHLWLFSPKYPRGLEIAKIDVEVGNVQSWSMNGQVLWLVTELKERDVAPIIWSLDLSKVL